MGRCSIPPAVTASRRCAAGLACALTVPGARSRMKAVSRATARHSSSTGRLASMLANFQDQVLAVHSRGDCSGALEPVQHRMRAGLGAQ